MPRLTPVGPEPFTQSPYSEDAHAWSAAGRWTAGRGFPVEGDTSRMSDTLTGSPALDAVNAALATVQDPEINRPLPELGMVKDVQIGVGGDPGAVRIEVYLTVSGCPMRETITNRVTQAVSAVPGVTSVQVGLDVMNDEQRTELRKTVRGTDAADPVIPFAQPGSLTRVYAVASGKGGVGKSSVTVNLAASLAKRGLSVGVVDADIYGHSVPRMLGVDDKPTQVDNMIMPPQSYGVKVISIGMFTPGNTPVVWRGPMLHRALQQFLADVWWGDLDVLLLDLPPGTGDVAISVAQLVPNAEILVVTTPQLAAAEVAERAGAIATQTHQQVVGVVENMSWLELPDGSRMDLFGSGGGAAVSDALTKTLGARVPLLGQIPLDTRLREAGDAGVPIVLAQPDAPAAQALEKIAEGLAVRSRGLAGMSLGLTPVRH
jgi:ATP-binding protein involved in chromosome partitioning